MRDQEGERWMHNGAGGLLASLPEDLRGLLENGHLIEDTLGRSSSHVFRVKRLPGVGNAYLKMQQANEDDDLRRERDVLEWLRSRLPVPEVLYFGQRGAMQYLLISEIPGANAADRTFTRVNAAADMVKALAQGLRQTHAVDITGCPFDRRLDVVLVEAELRVERGLVDTANVQPENLGQIPEGILRRLRTTRPATEDLVFTHGDYCLPNIILERGKVSGFIDLGRAGIADRYADIALAVRSLTHNMQLPESPQLVDLFLREYGLRQADVEKIAYYILLDELF